MSCYHFSLTYGWCRSAAAEANPNVSGKDSTSSTTSTGSEGSTSDSDGSEIEGNLDVTDDDRSPTSHDRASGLVSLKVDSSMIIGVTWIDKGANVLDWTEELCTNSMI